MLSVVVTPFRVTAAKVGLVRRWIESIVLGLLQWATRVLAVVGWFLVVAITVGVLYWLAARMFGWPIWVQVRFNAAEIMGVGVFMFCAAFALKR